MGSQGGAVQEPNTTTTTTPLVRQGSLYNLTLDEVHNQLGNLGKPLGSMNLDELLKGVWSAEVGGEVRGLDFGGGDSDMQDGQTASGSSLNPQGSLTLSRDLSRKTVDEVWRDMQLKKGIKKSQERQPTLGEMTLEDFLVKAGVVADSNVASSQHGHWIQYQHPSLQHQNMVGGYVAGHAIQQPFQGAVNLVLDAAYSEPASLIGALSDTQTPNRKRLASGDVVEKTVERRHKRMIKNRESAARSRARRQVTLHLCVCV